MTTTVISGTVTTSNLEILTAIISEGDITVNTPNLLLQNGAFVGSTVFTSKNTSIEGAGDIIISNSQQVEVTGSFITTLANRNTATRAGDITIHTERLLVNEGAAIASATFGNGDGGDHHEIPIRTDAGDSLSGFRLMFEDRSDFPCDQAGHLEFIQPVYGNNINGTCWGNCNKEDKSLQNFAKMPLGFFVDSVSVKKVDSGVGWLQFNLKFSP